jgi:hypothetical protein
MSRRFLAFLPLIALLGCAASGPSPETVKWYDAKTQEWVDSVVASCEATHVNYAEKRSPVDCQVQVPTNLMMSFPSTTFYKHDSGVAQFIQEWCGSISARFDKESFYTFTFRKEKIMMGTPCKSSKETR